jgi:hypothetical protein
MSAWGRADIAKGFIQQSFVGHWEGEPERFLKSRASDATLTQINSKNLIVVKQLSP